MTLTSLLAYLLAAPRPVVRRGVLPLAAATLLLLAGCGGGGGDQEASGETRAVEHARGTTDVPEDPQRVVVLEPVQLDTAVALGEPPVGTAVLDEAAGPPAYLGDDLGDTEVVGTVPEPDLERIAALEPDLILGTESRHSALYDQLGSIAPTVFMETQEDPWRDNAALVGRALGQEEEVEELLATYDERCAEVAEQVEADSTAQLLRPRDGILSVYGPTSFAGSTLECAGLSIPERDFEGSISVDVSPEQVLGLGADLVLVTTVDPEDESTLPPAVATNAEELGRVELVDQSFWITGVGPRGGLEVLDDLSRILDAS